MEFRQLRYFLQIAQEKNYSTAAKKLYISQPALSWTIRQLEQELGAKLFIQEGRKLQLTVEGNELWHHAAHLVASQEQVLALFQARSGLLCGHINLGIPALFGTLHFMQAIMRFIDIHPKIGVDMHNAGSIQIQDMVIASQVDVGIVSYPFPNAELDAIELPHVSYPLSLVVANDHPLAKVPAISFSDLKDQQFILLGKGYTVGEITRTACKEAGFKPQVCMTSSEWNVICEAVAHSNKITILPSPFVNKVQDVAVTFIPLHSHNSLIPIALVTQKQAEKSLPVQRFLQFMLDEILNHEDIWL